MLRQLAAAVGIDNEVTLNAALAHGILFLAWVGHVRDMEHTCRRSRDVSTAHGTASLSQHTRWWVNTGALAYTICSDSPMLTAHTQTLLIRSLSLSCVCCQQCSCVIISIPYLTHVATQIVNHS